MARDILTQLASQATDQLRQQYGRAPQWIVAAPGRVNLIGEHTDYNDGFVLPMAIERYCVIAAAPATDEGRLTTDERKLHLLSVGKLFSVATGDEVSISLPTPRRHPIPGHWSNYFAGVVAGCRDRSMRPADFEAIVESSVPFGGGLSSSAAIEVATATLIEAMTGTTLEPVTKALLCQKAEHEYAGVPCGIMDQFASVLGRADHLMLLDCRSRHIEHIPFVDPNVTVLIVNTNVKHELSGGEYAERRGQCESAARKFQVASLRDVTIDQVEANRSNLDAVEYRRARHVVTELTRTVEAAAAVKSNDWPTVGRLMYASHDSLRDDYEVSCEELDLLVNLAREIGSPGGVIGSRMTGGGFGGCTVSLVETSRVGQITESLAEAYKVQTGLEPTIITSRPARGAHILKTK